MKSKLGILIIIFFLALSVRLIYLEQVKNTPLFSNPAVDSGDYHKAGLELAGKAPAKGFGKGPLRMPFYHNFLGLVYGTLGPSAYFAAFVQFLLGSIICCLIYVLGRNVFSEKVGIVAGALSCIYWPLVAFGGKTLPVNLAIFFSLLAVICLQKLHEKRRWVWAFAGGLFLAFSSLARPNILLLLPAAALWIFFVLRKGGSVKAIALSAIFVLSFLIILTPYGMKDYAAREEFIPVQRNYASTLYMGTDLDLVNLKPGSAWKAKMIELLRMDLISRKERDLYWLREIKKSFTENPAKYFNNILKKIYMTWNYYEFAPYENINYFRKKSTFLSMPLLNFGSIAAFSVLGMFFISRGSAKKAAPLYLFIIVYLVSLLPFLPLSRYRLLLVPFLIIFASSALINLYEAALNRKWAHLVKSLVLLIPVLVITNSSVMLAFSESFSRPYYHEGRAYLLEGNTDKALVSLNRALEKHPKDADIYETLGDVFLKLDELNRAEVSYRKALEVEDEFPEAMEKLAVVYAKKGEIDRAIGILKKALSSFPVEYASTHINLATCYSLKGDNESARKELERALVLDPDNPQAIYKLEALQEND
jgi:tetratricopeptide (TPR) repeat protein